MTIEKAFIVSKVNSYQYKVRIPTFNKSAGAVGGTPDSELYTATVSTSPGITPAYNTGDVVYVCFEKDDESIPVVVGALLNSNTKSIQADAEFSSLTVTTNVTLPDNTTIGKVSGTNIATLEGQSLKISDEFNRVDNAIKLNNSDIGRLQNDVIYLTEHTDTINDNLSYARRLLDIHTANEDIHVLKTDKEAWNTHIQNGDLNRYHPSYADWTSHVDLFTKHKDNGDSERQHWTTDEKKGWTTHISNSDTDHYHPTATQVANYNTHLLDTYIHVTEKDKTNWNNHTHTTFKDLTLTGNIVLTAGETYGTDPPNDAVVGQLFFQLGD